MIPLDQGGGGWGYQVVNIGGARGSALSRNPQFVESHCCKKKRARMERRAVRRSQQRSQQRFSSRNRSIARGIARNGGRLRMCFRLTEVTSALRRVPV